MTKVVKPAKREYKIKNYYNEGTIALHFTCDTQLASNIEIFPCTSYLNEIQSLFLKLNQIHNDKLLVYNSLSVSLLYQIFAMLEKKNSSSYLPTDQYNVIKDSISYLVLWHYRFTEDKEYLAKNYLKVVKVLDYYRERYERNFLGRSQSRRLYGLV